MPKIDQKSGIYKERLRKESVKLIHKDAKASWAQKLVTTILVGFSSCFWTTGCPAPQVEGFVAKIHLKPDAVGRCQQPFRLS